MRRIRIKRQWELVGKVLAVVGAVALMLLLLFSERLEQQASPTESPAPTETLVPTKILTPTKEPEIPTPTEPPAPTTIPTALPEPTETPKPTEEPKDDGIIEMPFVPAKREE